MNANAPKKNLTNELAKERNRAAADRTLMAWIRTSISLFGFGFAIAKSYEYVEADYIDKYGKALDTFHTPVIFGVSFILIGIIGVILGVLQYTRRLERFRSDDFEYSEPLPLPKIIAILLLGVGMLGLAMVLI